MNMIMKCAWGKLYKGGGSVKNFNRVNKYMQYYTGKMILTCNSIYARRTTKLFSVKQLRIFRYTLHCHFRRHTKVIFLAF